MEDDSLKKEWIEDKRFINPYNFVSVSLNGNKSLSEPNTDGKLHTGVLHCTLTAKTPIAVPDTSEATADSIKHKYYPFFQYRDGVCTIPGSTLRGSIRSMYEALTDSCFATARADSVITTRGKGTFKPGILVKEGKQWTLYRAERYLIDVYPKEDEETEEDNKAEANKGAKANKKVKAVQMTREELLEKCSFGEKVHFSSDTDDKKRKVVTDLSHGKEEGYLYIGEPSPTKRYESIFRKGSKVALIGDEDVEGLLQTLDIYQNEKINKMLTEGHSGYQGAEKAFERGIVPIWYGIIKDKDNKDIIYLSMASIGRTAYKKSMGELLDKRAACTTEELCKACSLFGMASKNYNSGSKVRVTDAKALDCKVREGVLLRELSSPNSSYLPFYATRTADVKNWSYDTNANIKGRKFYWHSNSNYYMDKTNTETKRNATMDLVEAGAVFEFKVYYDYITEKQLQELIWTLTLGDNSEKSNYCYKIGHGKPIGLGSVKICVKRKEERSYDPEKGYQIADEEVAEIKENPFDTPSTASILKQILTISNMTTVEKEKVEYPWVIPVGNNTDALNENDKAAHQWFSYNYTLGDKVKNTLPEISDNKTSLTLPALGVSKSENS